MPDVIIEYDRMYSENPTRWDIKEIDEQRFEALAEYENTGNKILDIGCGSGHTLAYFAERWKDKQYYGIDWSQVAVRHAAPRLPDMDIRCETLEACKLKQMNIVILGGVAEHFENLPHSLRFVKKIASNDGIVFMEVPNCISYSGAHGEGFYKTKANGQTEWHMTRQRWEEVLHENGFEIIKSITGKKVYNEFIWILKKQNSKE